MNVGLMKLYKKAFSQVPGSPAQKRVLEEINRLYPLYSQFKMSKGSK